MKILVTGGAGYIGTHTCIALLQQGHEVVIVDNLCNSKKVAVDRVEEITGKKVAFYPYDVCKEEKVRAIFSKEEIDAVIHFAGLKAVGESVAIPLRYYDNNLISTLVLLKVMEEYGVKNFVFSSSATVYGDPASVPIKEDFPLSTASPYGTTKLMIEQILKDYAKANPDFNPVILRYFNPVGAHTSGLLGEDPNGIPNNLVPYITQTVVGRREKVHVFGNDYPTPDGTGVRDYIHVMDLAEGHAAALKLFENGSNCGLKIYNLGTGKGYSVLEMIAAFSKAAGKEIPYVIDPRRPGDIPECYADCTKAYEELGWKATHTLEDMCVDSLRWQEKNPNGFEGEEKKLVLASASPSRKMLLEQAGLTFDVIVSGVDENVPEGYTPAQTVECLAKRKGEAVLPLCPENSAIIAADSVVSIDGKILGKPENDEAAKATLRQLSGRTHQLFTGVCILANGKTEVFSQVTEVTFYPLTEEEIGTYVASGESRGRAGAYGIEGEGVTLVQHINGDYSNIVGLPVAETLRRLDKML